MYVCMYVLCTPCIHIRIQTYINKYTHTHTHTSRGVYLNICANARKNADNIPTKTLGKSERYSQLGTLIQGEKALYVYICIHTCMNIYIYIYIYIYT